MRGYSILIGCILLSACGDGGGSSSTTPPPVTPPPVATLNVTLTPSTTASTTSDVDSNSALSLQASFTGTTTDPIIPQLTFDNTGLALDGTITSSGSTYTAALKTQANLSAGTYKTVATFRLCKDSACTTVYPGSTQSFTFTNTVKIADWTTRQRNAAHNGFVHAAFDPTKFAKAWEYGPANATGFVEAAAREGTVFLTQSNSDGSTMAVAVNGGTGTQAWQYSIGRIHNSSGPALSGNRVAFSTMSISSGNNPLLVLTADTGQFVRNLPFAAQWSTFSQPTPWGDTVHIASGYYGNVLYGFDLKGGTELWQANGSGGRTWDGEAPAVDSNYVYYYSGNLDVVDRLTGKIFKTIADPFWVWNGYSYGGTPMLASNGHVIAYSGNGQGTYSVAFPLVDYDVQAGKYLWRTASGYTAIPAVASGVIFAASNQTSELDAIDEATGAVLWAWPLPVGEQFTGNVVVTDTLVFVSTNVSVYAIALDGTHQTKWSAKTPGTLVISPDAKLIVSPISGSSPAKVTAYNLQ